MNRPTVVILGSNPMTRLSLIRSIGEAVDCEIAIVDMVRSTQKKRRNKPVDCYSKYVGKYLLAPKYEADTLCELLLKEFPDNGSKTYLLSVDDDSATLIDSVLNHLKGRFVCANIHYEQGRLAQLMNKSMQKELAKNFGFEVTNSWIIENHGGQYVVPEGITFPCYLKGLMSYHTMKAQQRRFDSLKELETFLEKLASRFSYPMLAEDFIEIDKSLGVIGFCDGKDCVIPCITELLESGLGNHNGVSALGLVRKEQQNEGITTKVADFVKHIGLFGLFNVDVAMSKNKLYFIELNLRFAAYGYAVTKAGVNLPEMFINSTCNKIKIDTFSECFYMNEKVALDDVVEGHRTIKDFKRLRQKADFGLMDNPEDREPYRRLIRHALSRYFVKRVKKFVKYER